MRATLLAIILTASVTVAQGQTAPARGSGGAAAGKAIQQAEPATKLGAFRPSAGSVSTFGYDELGGFDNVKADVRELRDAKTKSAVRGVVVTITESAYEKERAFIDADEIPELIAGIDALVAVDSNPTRFTQFEVQYTTRDGLRLDAFNSGLFYGASGREIKYSIRAGTVTYASDITDKVGMQRLKTMLLQAQQKLQQVAGAESAPQ